MRVYAVVKRRYARLVTRPQPVGSPYWAFLRKWLFCRKDNAPDVATVVEHGPEPLRRGFGNSAGVWHVINRGTKRKKKVFARHF